MNILITTGEDLKVRQVTQFLASITLLDDATTLTEDSANNLVEWLNQLYPGQSLGTELQNIGRKLLDPKREPDYDQPPSDLLRMALWQQAIVGQCPSEEDLELIRVSKGSLRGRFRKKIKAAREKLRKVLQGARDLLPSRNAAAFNVAARGVLQEIDLPEPALAVAAGLTVTAAYGLHHLFVDLKASELKVWKDLGE